MHKFIIKICLWFYFSAQFIVTCDTAFYSYDVLVLSNWYPIHKPWKDTVPIYDVITKNVSQWWHDLIVSKYVYAAILFYLN